MNFTDWIGFIGVTILLIAFFLNLNNRLKKDNFVYLLMNVLGAGLACFASVLLKYMPFIIIEATWTLVSAYGLLQFYRTKNASS
jgi:hypothetical protein